MTTNLENTSSEDNMTSEEEMTDERQAEDTETEAEKAGAEDTETGAETGEKSGDEPESGQDAAGTDETGKGTAGDKGAGETPEETGAEEEDEDLKTKHLRLMADFQNYKRRAEEAKTMSYSHGKEDLLTDLLPIIDNFERALESEGEGGNFKEGMEMIFKQLMDILERTGLKEIEAKGKEFDPNYHNAVMTEDSDEYESNHVSEVLQKGYTFKDKVIRPSMVKVTN